MAASGSEANPAPNRRLKKLAFLGALCLGTAAIILGVVGGLGYFSNDSKSGSSMQESGGRSSPGSSADASGSITSTSGGQKIQTSSDVDDGSFVTAPIKLDTVVSTPKPNSQIFADSVTTAALVGEEKPPASANVAVVPLTGSAFSSGSTSYDAAMALMSSNIDKQTAKAFIKVAQDQICVARNGTEFMEMMNKTTSCVLIKLLIGITYEVTSVIDVWSPKIILGNPLILPIIDGSGIERIFNVHFTGKLDLRFVKTYRGGGRVIPIVNVPVLRGGAVYVMKGGKFYANSCVFTSKPPDAGSTFFDKLKKVHDKIKSEGKAKEGDSVRRHMQYAPRVRVYGGHVYISGGYVTLDNVAFFNQAEGMMDPGFLLVGGDVYMGDGTLEMNGCSMTSNYLLIDVVSAGTFSAVIGGVAIFNGVSWVLNVGTIRARGAGILHYHGGGVGIISGGNWNANLGELAFYGTGVFQFMGGGVLIISGASMDANVGLLSAAGAGLMTMVGGGTAVYTGTYKGLKSGITFAAGAALCSFLGGGTIIYTGTSIIRIVAIVATYNAGGSAFLGGGVMIATGTVSADIIAIACAVEVGVDFFMGAGVFVLTGHFSLKVFAILFGPIVGLIVFQGAGVLVLAGVVIVAYLFPGIFFILPVSLPVITGGVLMIGLPLFIPLRRALGISDDVESINLASPLGKHKRKLLGFNETANTALSLGNMDFGTGTLDSVLGIMSASLIEFMKEMGAFNLMDTHGYVGFTDGPCPAACNLCNIQSPTGKAAVGNCSLTCQYEKTCTKDIFSILNEFSTLSDQRAQYGLINPNSSVTALAPPSSFVVSSQFSTGVPKMMSHMEITLGCTTGYRCGDMAAVTAALKNFDLPVETVYFVGEVPNLQADIGVDEAEDKDVEDCPSKTIYTIDYMTGNQKALTAFEAKLYSIETDSTTKEQFRKLISAGLEANVLCGVGISAKNSLAIPGPGTVLQRSSSTALIPTVLVDPTSNPYKKMLALYGFEDGSALDLYITDEQTRTKIGEITFDKIKPYFTVDIPEDLVSGPMQLAKMWFEVVQNGDALGGIPSALLL